MYIGPINNQELPNKIISAEIVPQPEFPAVDINDENVVNLIPYLTLDAGVAGQGKILEGGQHRLYEVSTWAMNSLGISLEFRKKEYQSFTRGFATFEAISDAVKSERHGTARLSIGKAYDQLTAVRQMLNVFLGHFGPSPYDDMNPDVFIPEAMATAGELQKQIEEARQYGSITAQSELASMYDTWQEERPNTYEVLLTTAPEGASLKQIAARLIGARAAYTLQVAS